MASQLFALDLLNIYLTTAFQLINNKELRKEPAEIAVIGAGISGLTAASVLNKCEIFKVSVLEARDRIGGRMHSVPMGGSGAVVDLGASWIHGIGKGADGDTKGKWKNQWNPVY